MLSKSFLLPSDSWDTLYHFSEIFKTKIREEAWRFRPPVLWSQPTQAYSLIFTHLLVLETPAAVVCHTIRQNCTWDCISIRYIVFIHLMENQLGNLPHGIHFLFFSDSLQFNDSMIHVPYFWNGSSTHWHFKQKRMWVWYLVAAVRQKLPWGVGDLLVNLTGGQETWFLNEVWL